MEDQEVVYRRSIFRQLNDAFHTRAEGSLSAAKIRGDWIPRRYCSRDSVLAMWAYRIRKRKFEIGLFAAKDHYRFAKGNSARGAMVVCLGEALLNTGKMELEFVGSSPGDPNSGYESGIPEEVRKLAEGVGITLPPGRSIPNGHGQRLFLALSHFSQDLAAKLAAVGFDPLHAALHTHRGVWSVGQLEAIVRFCRRPEKVLRDSYLPEERFSMILDFSVARRVIQAERVKTLLEGQDELGPVAMSWEAPDLIVAEAAKGPSITTADGRSANFPPKSKLRILLYPDSTEGYFASGLKHMQTGGLARPQLVCVSKDFSWLPSAERARFTAHSRTLGSEVVVLIDTRDELDDEIRKKARQLQSTFAAAPEMKE